MKNCGNCIHYINGYCWKDVNNLDPTLLNKDLDSREPEESCDEWEYNELGGE